MRVKFCNLKAITSAALLVVPMATSGLPAYAGEAQGLDGKVFVADAGEKGKAADEKNDVITFNGGRFHSSTCDQWGFDQGEYKSARSGDVVTFDVETRSEKDGRLVWKGTVRGDEIEGTFVHYRKPGFFMPNPTPVEHWFKGRAKS